MDGAGDILRLKQKLGVAIADLLVDPVIYTPLRDSVVRVLRDAQADVARLDKVLIKYAATSDQSDELQKLRAELAELRERYDELDEHLVVTEDHRASLAKELEELKKMSGMSPSRRRGLRGAAGGAPRTEVDSNPSDL